MYLCTSLKEWKNKMGIPKSISIFAQAGVEMKNKFSDLAILSMGLGQDSTTILNSVSEIVDT